MFLLWTANSSSLSMDFLTTGSFTYQLPERPGRFHKNRGTMVVASIVPFFKAGYFLEVGLGVPLRHKNVEVEGFVSVLIFCGFYRDKSR